MKGVKYSNRDFDVILFHLKNLKEFTVADFSELFQVPDRISKEAIEELIRRKIIQRINFTLLPAKYRISMYQRYSIPKDELDCTYNSPPPVIITKMSMISPRLKQHLPKLIIKHKNDNVTKN